jgi:signal transduction histidine kinase
LSERLALEELRNDLMSMLVHDLRSPLGNIISSLDILASTLPEADATQQSLLSIAGRATARMSRLVDSLLDLRRLEAGELSLNRAPTDLAALLAEALEQVQPVAEARRLALRLDVPDDLPLADLDLDMMRRVLANLLDNAVRYTPPQGAITLSARAEPDQVLVTVCDTGPGVAEADRQRIFDKFARAQREAAPKGLGLGLAFCKLAVEAHGGRIWVESGAQPGAAFHFTLPRAGRLAAPRP